MPTGQQHCNSLFALCSATSLLHQESECWPCVLLGPSCHTLLTEACVVGRQGRPTGDGAGGVPGTHGDTKPHRL